MAGGRVAVALEAHPVAVRVRPPGSVTQHVVPVLAGRAGSVVGIGSRALDQSAARSMDPPELRRVWTNKPTFFLRAFDDDQFFEEHSSQMGIQRRNQ